MEEIKKKRGRPVGTCKAESEKGRKTIFKNFTVSCSPLEYEKLKLSAEKSNKTISRYIIDKLVK